MVIAGCGASSAKSREIERANLLYASGIHPLLRQSQRRPGCLTAQYGWQLSLAVLIYRLRGFYRERVVLELT